MKNEPSWRCCKIIGRSFEKICNVVTFHIWSLKCLVAHDRLSDTCPSDNPISIALAIFIRIEIYFEIKDRDGKFLSSSVMLALTTELRQRSVPRSLFPISPFSLPVGRSPLPVTRCPFPVARCPLPVARCPLPVARYPFLVLRSPFSVLRSPFTAPRSPFLVLVTFLASHR